ncbi:MULTISPECIES: PepSY domain-containing protein [unclassified Massilia]|uniref:PepSY-associated TM helix domain-containing protein n=1 Tax=unclassified Massilia TaxID=2609279 RepID=UPI0017874809|nr:MULTISPECIES: PepSY-associated TM helix domain-containing protein [unclassified Massilia]MBD8529673.1 PepSY domain-containing protein [Massilia sp. CFBP 13647]MBD8673240.1 PepSY domain-containing protein [Massilia sp. CFBP 13721]
MKEGFRQSMAWLHTWSGLLVCWLLLLIFMAGTSAYYRDEITLWMKPELHAAAPTSTPAVAATHAVAALQARAPQATRWFINLPDGRTPLINASWTMPPKKGMSMAERRAAFRKQMLALDPAGGAVVTPRDTRGGEFLYRMHFDLYYMSAIWGRWIVGICAMAMLVAIVSGVITHKRIFKDFFTFRPKKGQRSWLDAHNAAAVLALPFHLMITYTGIVTLMFMYMQAPTQALYKGDQQAMFAEVFPGNERSKPARSAAPLADIGPMLAQAEARWGVAPTRIVVAHPNDANATVQLVRQSGAQLSNIEPSLTFSGVSGALIAASTEPGGVSAMRRAVYGLHVAHFADGVLRALFFMCGLAGCAMVATGALLWGVKERQKAAKALARGGKAGFGVRLVDALNIGTIAGLPIAFGAYFWSNRLLPPGLEERAAAEAHCFFIAWGLALLLAQCRPTRAMWRLQLLAGAALLAGLPLLNALTTATHLGATLFGAPGLRPVAAFDLVTLALGALLAYAAWWLKRRDARVAAGPRALPAAAAGTEDATRKEAA